MTPEPTRKWTLAVCGGTHAVQDGLGATLYVLLPVLAQALGLSYAEVGLVRATKSAATSLFELPSGLIAERLGERRLLVFGLASGGFGYLWLGTATGLGVVLASLALAGLGAGFQHALCSSLVSRAYEEEGRRTALGVYNSSGDAGKLIFTGLFSVLVGAGLAWQGIVALLGMAALVMSAGVYLALRRLAVGEGGPISASDGQPPRSAGWGIRDPMGFGALCSAVFLDTAVQSSFLVFLAFVVAEKGVATEYAAFAVVLTLLGGIFGKVGCGVLADRLGVRRSLALAQLSTAAGILGLVFVPPLAAFFLLPLLGMFLQGSSSITYGSVGDFVDTDRQSRGFGLMYSVGSLASVSGPVLFGVVGDAFGLEWAMFGMAAVSILVVWPSMWLGDGARG